MLWRRTLWAAASSFVSKCHVKFTCRNVICEFHDPSRVHPEFLARFPRNRSGTKHDLHTTIPLIPRRPRPIPLTNILKNNPFIIILRISRSLDRSYPTSRVRPHSLGNQRSHRLLAYLTTKILCLNFSQKWFQFLHITIVMCFH